MDTVPPSAPSRTRGVLINLAKFTVGALIVVYLLQKYDAHGVVRGLAGADLAMLGLAWLWAVLTLVCYAVMTRVALRPLKMPFGTFALLKILFQIRFYALFLPGGANALVKWYKLAQPAKQPGQSLALMAFTRVLHLFAMLLLGVAGIWGDSHFPWPSVEWVMLAASVGAAAMLVPFMMQPFVGALRRYFEGPWRKAPIPSFVRARAEKLLNIATAFGRLAWWEALAVFFFALAGNALDIVQHVCIAHAVGIEISIATMAWLRGIIILCQIVPISLSGLGLREASVVALLTFYGVPETDALAYSLLFYGVFVVGKGAIGGVLEFADWFRGTRITVPPASP